MPLGRAEICENTQNSVIVAEGYDIYWEDILYFNNAYNQLWVVPIVFYANKSVLIHFSIWLVLGYYERFY